MLQKTGACEAAAQAEAAEPCDATDLRRLLQPDAALAPPFVNWPKRFGVIWSAKSGCTQALLWFLAHCGLLRAAAFYSFWPHNFREQVVYRSETYHSWLRECDLAEMRWVRVIRDPFKRAVSSYRHILLTAYEDERISAQLGRAVTKASGYSFMEFLTYLSANDLTCCDIHYIQQYNPIEKHVLPIVINIDQGDADSAFAAAERTLGLPPLPRHEARTLREERARIAALLHAQRAEASGADMANERFNAETSLGQWPDYSAFLTEETRNLVSTLYAADYDAYGEYLAELPPISLASRLWARSRRLVGWTR